MSARDKSSDKPHSSLREGFADLSARADQVRLSGHSLDRLVERLDGPRPRRRLWLLAAGLAAAAAVLILALRSRPVRSIGSFEIASSSRDFAWQAEPGDTLRVSTGEARLALPELGTTIGITAGTRLHRRARAIDVLAGRADFDVTLRATGAVPEVVVSGGIIRITGTQFLVDQGADGGMVWLKRGHIRFEAPDGQTRDLAGGETLHWPLPMPTIGTPSPMPSSESPAVVQSPPSSGKPIALPRTRKPTTGVVEEKHEGLLATYLGEMDALRIRHDYTGLAKRLEQVLATGVREPLGESLSFELCDVLARQVREQAKACARIAWHIRRYPSGVYEQQLRQTRISLGCAP